MWTTSRCKHKPVGRKRSEGSRSLRWDWNSKSPNQSEATRRCPVTGQKTHEDPDHHTTLHTLSETRVRLSKKEQWRKRQLARVCASAAWQRLERFLQTSSWKLVVDRVHVNQAQKPGRKCSVIGMLQSESEAVTRGVVSSARSSWKKNITDAVL